MNRHSFTSRTKAANYIGKTSQVDPEKATTKRCLTFDAHTAALAAREAAARASLNADALGAALAAREKAELFNADAHGAPAHDSSRGGCIV